MTREQLIILAAIACCIAILCGCPWAHSAEYTNEQIVNAIYKAEGGQKAQYPYGIRSVKCVGEAECRTICLQTVKNNRKRFERATPKFNGDYIAYLGSRYCPTSGRGISKEWSALNRNWIKNVRYFLSKEGT